MESTSNPDFQHGYASGVGDVNRQAYEGYLSSRVSADWLAERIAETRTALQQLDAQVAATTDARRTAYAQWQTHTLQVERLTKQIAWLEGNRQTAETEQATLRQRRANVVPEYSLLAGLLFLVAGISFLAGDLIISHEIVAYALNIRNPNEAWAFAFGLAMVSILLKPAYDRLIEQPYQQNPEQNRRVYQRFKLTLAGFAVLTLAVLGWFRYEAYRTDQLKAAINKSVRQMQLNSTAADGSLIPLDAAMTRRIESQLAESSALNLALVDSPWALLSFVLSGILFALAGAVCLGIALPVLSAFWFRWLQADIRLGRLRRRVRRLSRELDSLEQQLAERQTQQAVLRYNLDLLPTLAELKATRQTLTVDLGEHLAEQKLARIDSRISTFNDGYDRGEAARVTLTDDQQRYWRQHGLAHPAGNQPNGVRAADPHPLTPTDGSVPDESPDRPGKPANGRSYPTNRPLLPEDHL